MRLGEVLNGYRIVTEPTQAGAGMSQWAIVEKSGEHSFIKMYLAPKFPMPDSPGSEAGKAKRREQCQAFEQRHLTIARRLRADVPGAGHLITTKEFFRVGSCYYKVTRLVNTDNSVALEVCPPRQQVIALRSLLFSLRLMHEQEVVHGDLKPENVLFERAPSGAVTCKVIDFDEAYLSGQPPVVTEIVGDVRYYSPELFRYIKGDESIRGNDLTTQSDVFALGLLLHSLFTGELPAIDRPGYVAEAVIDGVPLRIDPRLPAPLRPAVRAMLQLEAHRRPTVAEIIDRFRDLDLTPGIPEGPAWVTEFTAPGGLRRPPEGTAAAFNPVKTPPPSAPPPSTPPDPPVAPATPVPSAPVASPPPATPISGGTVPPPAAGGRLRINIGRAPSAPASTDASATPPQNPTSGDPDATPAPPDEG